MRLFVVIISIILSIYILIGCNTLRGVGKDVESAGEAIQRATDKR